MYKFVLFSVITFMINMSTRAQEMEIEGQVQATSFKGDGAEITNLAIPSRSRSVVIMPNQIGGEFLFNATFTSIGLGGLPTINMPDGISSEIALSLPVPSDWDSTSLNVTVLYTSNDASGEFDCSFFNRGVALGASVNASIGGGGLPLDAVAAPFILHQGSTAVTTSITPDTKVLILRLRRRGATATDTSTGILHIVGIVLEYID